MSDHRNDQGSGLESRSKALFDEQVAATDGATRSRLNQARQRAMAQLEPRSAWSTRWLPAGAAAAATALVIALLLARGPESGSEFGPTMATDLEILLETDDLELVEELEFYAWLDEQPELEEPAGEDNGVG